MPLLHQDNGHGGGGASNDNRRSLADFIGLETAQLLEANVSRMAHRTNGSDDWRWEEPSSPEAAQTPSSFVPANCFPSANSRAFASYTDRANSGEVWPGDPPAEPITDLVSSLKALAMPAGSLHASVQVRLSYEKLDRVDSWSQDRTNNGSREVLPRRASFCGVVGSVGSPGSPGSPGPPGPPGLLAAGARLSLSPARWAGSLPPRTLDPAGPFSVKLFLGGLPWDIAEQALLNTFRHFHPVSVEWPPGAPRGYAYLTLQSERRVRALLAAARRDRSGWYYRVPTRAMRTKEVQIIPWSTADSNWVLGGSVRLEPARTVFVGALHGMLSASALATIMNDLFSGVIYAGIDTDKNKYPIGSGRVTFNNVHSYIRAVAAAYVEICTDKFEKKVQVDPYLEDSMCSVCNLRQGPYFCREPICFRYFCRMCWNLQHSTESHKQLMRNSKMAARAPDLYNGGFNNTNEGTPSPSSGTSGSGASELEPSSDDVTDTWLH